MSISYKRGFIALSIFALSVSGVGYLQSQTVQAASCTGKKLPAASMYNDDNERVAYIRIWDGKGSKWCARLYFDADFNGGRKHKTVFRIENKTNGKGQSDNGNFSVATDPVVAYGKFCNMRVRGYVVVNGEKITVNNQTFACN